MNLERANLNNLQGLWRLYGARIVDEGAAPTILQCPSWPYRCWLDGEPESESIASARLLERLLKVMGPQSVVPLWRPLNSEADSVERFDELEQRLRKHQFTHAFDQTAMSLVLADAASPVIEPADDLGIRAVESRDDVLRWVEVSGLAFGYSIDAAVIEALLPCADVQLLLMEVEGRAVATGLLYRTGQCMGVHQIGTLPEFQGRGIARKIMHYVIALCTDTGVSHIVLQASDAGKPLYESLGFDAQFLIKNFRR